MELTYQLPEDRPIQLAVDNSELRQGYCAWNAPSQYFSGSPRFFSGLVTCS